MLKPRNAWSRGAAPKSRTPSTVRCQKCLEYGHYSYECKATERPYKARPTRSQQLKNPELLPKLSVDEAPNNLVEKSGIADKVLADKEAERQKRRRSESVSTYSSASESASTYSSDSESDDGGDRKRVRRRSRSPASDSSSSAASRGRSSSEERLLPRRKMEVTDSGSSDSRDESERRRRSHSGRHVSGDRDSPPPRHFRNSPPRRARSSSYEDEPRNSRSRWDQR